MTVMSQSTIHELKKIAANVLPVSLDLDIDFSDQTDFIDLNLYLYMLHNGSIYVFLILIFNTRVIPDLFNELSVKL